MRFWEEGYRNVVEKEGKKRGRQRVLPLATLATWKGIGSSPPLIGRKPEEPFEPLLKVRSAACLQLSSKGRSAYASVLLESTFAPTITCNLNQGTTGCMIALWFVFLAGNFVEGFPLILTSDAVIFLNVTFCPSDSMFP